MGRWTQNLGTLPAISYIQVEEWANDGENIPKRIQTKGYSNWIEGYIHDVEGKQTHVVHRTCTVHRTCPSVVLTYCVVILHVNHE